jgi:hypothetical protein
MSAAAAQPRLVDPVDAFRLRCEARALLWHVGEIDLAEAVDALQEAAERAGLLDQIGQDQIQQIMSDAFAPFREARSNE